MSFFSAAMSGMGKFLGSANFGTALVGGLSSMFGGRSQRRNERRQRDHDAAMSRERIAAERDQINQSANQDRETMLYEMQLAEWQRQQRRREIARGGANFAQFAPAIQGYTNTAPISTAPVATPTAPRINL